MGTLQLDWKLRSLRNYFAMDQFLSKLSITVALTCLLVVSWQTICEATDLFQLVDKDVAVSVHARGLDSQWSKLRESEFSSRLQQASFFSDWVSSPDYAQLDVVRTAVEASSGKLVGQSMHELLGKDLVIAWYHQPGTKARLDRDCVLLVEAEDSAAMESALATWDVLEPQRRTTKKYQGVDCTHSVNAASPADGEGIWYTKIDRVLAMSAREHLIHRVIELAAELDGDSKGRTGKSGPAASSTSHPDCLAAQEQFAKAYGRRTPSEVAAIYVNPQILGREIGRVDKGLAGFESTLSRCQCLTLRLTFDDSLHLEFIADYDNADTPDWWQQWVAVASHDRSFLDRLPSNAVLAMSGQFSSKGVADAFRRTLQGQSRLPKDLVQVRRVAQGLLLGLDPLNDVLPALGPSWVTCVVSRNPEEGSATFPADWLFAVELAPRAPENRTLVSTESALDNSLSVGLGILAAVHNAKATGKRISVVKTLDVDDGTIRYADPVAFFQPAFGIAKGQLVLATTPELCKTFLSGSKSDTTDVAPADQVAKQPYGNLQTLFVSSLAAREMLTQYHGWFISQAKRGRVSEAEATRRLDQLDQFMRLLDSAWLTASVDESTFRISAGITAHAAIEDE